MTTIDEPQEAAAAAPPGYFATSRTARWGFLMALPLVGLYEWGIVMDDAQVRISAEVWMRMPLQWFGIAEIYLIPALVILIGLFIFIRDRNKPISLKPRHAALMIAESAIYAAAFAVVVGQATAYLLNLSVPTQEAEGLSLLTEIVLSIGAGIYEELLFRVILVGVLFWGLRLLLPNAAKWIPYTGAAIVGALAFSLMHYVGSHGDPLELASFTYRAIGGLVLNVIYLTRGFGVAAWTHALYDVYVVAGVFGG